MEDKMKNVLLIILISFFTFTIISCSIVTEKNEDTTTASTATLSAPDNLSASGANNTITLTWNSVSGATSYTLYWDNVSGIDNSDTPVSYTHLTLPTNREV